jgi:excinuclease ABC subunit A
MGPEAGEGGGEVVAQGPPAQIVKRKKESHTGRVLEGFLRERNSPASGSTARVAARLAAPAAAIASEAAVPVRGRPATAAAKARASVAATESKATAPTRARRSAAAVVAKAAKVTRRAGPQKRTRKAETKRKR